MINRANQKEVQGEKLKYLTTDLCQDTSNKILSKYTQQLSSYEMARHEAST
jgi:hypothetical protein